MFEALQLLSTCLWHMSGDHRVTEVLLQTKYSQFIYYYLKYVHAAAHTLLHSLTALYMSKIGKKRSALGCHVESQYFSQKDRFLCT